MFFELRFHTISCVLLGFFIIVGCANKEEEFNESEETSPEVVSIDPDNGASGVSPNSIQITFSKSIPPQNVTVDSDGKCTKNVQVSENNFYSCFPMSSIEDNSSSISFSLTPLTNNSKFPSNTEFKIKVSNNIQDYSKMGMAQDYASSFTTSTECSSDCDWSEVSSVGQFTGRSGHKAVVLNNFIYLIGGYDSTGTYTQDVMSSSTGSFEKISASWKGRINHVGLNFDGKIWLLGGIGENSAFYQEAWYSSDNGINWSEKNKPTWSAREGHAGVVFKGKMWVMGGLSGEAFMNDVYSTTDGESWNQVTSEASWSKRHGHAVVAFNDKLWLFGGYDNSTYLNDIWESSDGNYWTSPGNAFWTGRSSHQAIVFDGKVWIMGGKDSDGPKDQTYYSSDGTSWTDVTTSWSQRSDFSAVVFDNKIWIIGGDKGTSSNRQLSDVWKYGK